MTTQLQLIDGDLIESRAPRRRRSTSRAGRYLIDSATRERGLRGIAAARAVLAEVEPPAGWLEAKAS